MDKITDSTPVTLGDDKATFSPRTIAKWMGFNVSVSVVPVGIGQAFLTDVAPDADTPPRWSDRGGRRRPALVPRPAQSRRAAPRVDAALFQPAHRGRHAVRSARSSWCRRRGAAVGAAPPCPATKGPPSRPRRLGRRLALPRWAALSGGPSCIRARFRGGSPIRRSFRPRWCWWGWRGASSAGPVPPSRRSSAAAWSSNSC